MDIYFPNLRHPKFYILYTYLQTLDNRRVAPFLFPVTFGNCCSFFHMMKSHGRMSSFRLPCHYLAFSERKSLFSNFLCLVTKSFLLVIEVFLNLLPNQAFQKFSFGFWDFQTFNITKINLKNVFRTIFDCLLHKVWIFPAYFESKDQIFMTV